MSGERELEEHHLVCALIERRSSRRSLLPEITPRSALSSETRSAEANSHLEVIVEGDRQEGEQGKRGCRLADRLLPACRVEVCSSTWSKLH